MAWLVRRREGWKRDSIVCRVVSASICAISGHAWRTSCNLRLRTISNVPIAGAQGPLLPTSPVGLTTALGQECLLGEILCLQVHIKLHHEQARLTHILHARVRSISPLMLCPVLGSTFANILSVTICCLSVGFPIYQWQNSGKATQAQFVRMHLLTMQGNRIETSLQLQNLVRINLRQQWAGKMGFLHSLQQIDICRLISHAGCFGISSWHLRACALPMRKKAHRQGPVP